MSITIVECQPATTGVVLAAVAHYGQRSDLGQALGELYAPTAALAFAISRLPLALQEQVRLDSQAFLAARELLEQGPLDPVAPHEGNGTPDPQNRI